MLPGGAGNCKDTGDAEVLSLPGDLQKWAGPRCYRDSMRLTDSRSKLSGSHGPHHSNNCAFALFPGSRRASTS